MSKRLGRHGSAGRPGARETLASQKLFGGSRRRIVRSGDDAVIAGVGSGVLAVELVGAAIGALRDPLRERPREMASKPGADAVFALHVTSSVGRRTYLALPLGVSYTAEFRLRDGLATGASRRAAVSEMGPTQAYLPDGLRRFPAHAATQLLTGLGL